MKFEFSQQVLEKYSNVKYNENPSSGSRVVTSGRTDMTKPIVAFRNFANALKNVIPVTQGNRHHIKIIDKIPEQHIWKGRRQGTLENSLNGHCTPTAETTNVKVQNICQRK
jgi:hypothetical protein